MVHKCFYITSYVILMISLFEFPIGHYMFILSSKTFQETPLNEPFTRDSPRYPYWENTGKSPLSMDFYFFNWTNPEEINIEGKKPIFEEVGPYNFVVRRKRLEVTFQPKKNKVIYYQKHIWYFKEDRSVGTLEDKITTLDAVVVSAVHSSRFSSRDLQNLFYTIGLQSNFSVTKTVDELLFYGYEDKLQEIKLIPAGWKYLPYNRFGWFYLKNDSVAFDGFLSMDIGSSDISSLGNLVQWNFFNRTMFYRRPCNLVEGSAGDFWPPGQTKDDIKLFIPDLCRPLTYEFNKKTEYMNIEGNQYILGEKTLGRIFKKGYLNYETEGLKKSNLKNSPKMDRNLTKMNRCYCNGDCTPSGIINITSCYGEYPVFISLPHFYKGDPILSNQIVGMRPSEENHSYHITLDPATGIILEFSAKLQINMLLPSLQGDVPLKDFSQIYFPILWYSIDFKAPTEIISELQDVHHNAQFYITAGYVLCSLSIVGAFFISICLCYFYFKSNRTLSSQRPRDIPLMDLKLGGNAQD